MHVFIAGIMQADRRDKAIESQDYRAQITQTLQQHIPHVQIFDPYARDSDSVRYDDELARRTFLANTRYASEVDVLIAYLPLLSMGTAMEMWQAAEAGVYIVAVTPFIHHWAVKFTADEILPDLDALMVTIANGRYQNWQRK